MAWLWDREISQSTISRALRKIKHSRKKKHTGMFNGTKPNEQPDSPNAGDPKAAHLVYVDESGMDERDNYGYGYAPIGQRFYDLKSGRRQGRINMIAGVTWGRINCTLYD